MREPQSRGYQRMLRRRRLLTTIAPNTDPARDWRTDTVLTVDCGFGGFQSAMVLASLDRNLA
jgi:hypothetical protein